MKIYIHAGTFKTGSSGLQNSLYYQRDKLLQNGVLYPVTGISENGDSIGFRHSRFVYEYKKDTYLQLVQELRREIEEHKPEILIMSSEAWSVPEGVDSLYDLMDQLQS